MSSEDFLSQIESLSSLDTEAVRPLVFRNYTPLDPALYKFKLTTPQVVSQVEALYKKKAASLVAA